MRFASRGWGARIIFGLLCSCPLPAHQNQKDLCDSGYRRMEQYVDQLRRTGDFKASRDQLHTAQSELEAGYRGLLTAGDLAEAAICVIRLGSAQRLELLTARLSQDPDRADALVRDAKAHTQEGLRLAREARHRGYEAKALLGLVDVESLEDRQNLGAISARLSEAMRLSVDWPDRTVFQDALVAKVEFEEKRGELVSALSHASGLLAILKPGEDPYRLYRAHSTRGSVAQAMAQGCAYALRLPVDTCLRLHDLEKADYTHAREYATQAGFSYFASLASSLLAGVDRRIEYLRGYRSTFERPSAALPASVRRPEDVFLSENFLFPPDPKMAEKLAEEMRKSRLDTPDILPSRIIDIHLRAVMDDMAGRRDEALAGYLRVLQMIEDARQQIGEDTARGTYLNDKIEYFNRPILHYLTRKQYPEAFDLLERSRARATADLLATRTLGTSSEVGRKTFAMLALKRAEVAALQSRLFNSGFFPELTDQSGPTPQLEARLAALEAEYEQLLRSAAREGQPMQDLEVSRMATLAQVQQSLREDSASVLYYHVLDHGVLLIHVGPDSFHARNIFLPRYDLIRKAAALRASLRNPNAGFRDDLATEFFLFFIQPARQWLTSDRIIIIPHEDLISLPFQAFLDPSDGRYAGEKFQISYAPSATVLLGLHRHANLAGGRLFAASDPSLPASAEETATIARFYSKGSRLITGKLVGEADFKRAAGSFEFIHLAVHGKFDSEEPLLSRIRLSAQGNEDGSLTAAEMFGLPLEKARLITFSACETGRVRVTRSNEIQGIVQALLYSGAQSLLLSAWEVDSASTSLWMRTFYREAQTKTPAEAARSAVLVLRAEKRYDHPFYWAPFMLTGR